MSTEETRITRIAELAIDTGEAGACLVVIYGAHLGHKYEVTESVLMGRGDECDIVLTADSVSRKHALAEPAPPARACGTWTARTGPTSTTSPSRRRCSGTATS